MLHIELHKRVPQAHQEIDLAWVLTTFELCRSLFTKPEEIQSEMIFLRTQKPQPPVCLLIDYRPKGSCLRVQLFVQNGLRIGAPTADQVRDRPDHPDANHVAGKRDEPEPGFVLGGPEDQGRALVDALVANGSLVAGVDRGVV